MRTTIIVLCILFTTFHTLLHSQSSNLDDVNISILTCRSGDELYSTFGHTAIRLKTKTEDQVFNYGLFDFNTPNFYVKFMRGQLPYHLGSTTYGRFLQEYTYEERSVFEQKLNMTKEQKQYFLELLAENLKPENRQYKYDFFFDNCTTRVYDLLAKTYPLLQAPAYNESLTFRDMLQTKLQGMPWSAFGIDLVIGARADKLVTDKERMFLPTYFMEFLEVATVEDSLGKTSIAEEPYLVLDYEEKMDIRNEPHILGILLFSIGFLVLTIGFQFLPLRFANIFNHTLLIIGGVLGIFILFMWFGTDHLATKNNWNLLWLNPLYLVYLTIKGDAKKYIKWLLIGCLVVALIISFIGWPQEYNMWFKYLIMAYLYIVVDVKFRKEKAGNLNS